MAQRKGFVRRYWGSIAASPGNEKTIHWMVFCLALLGRSLLIPFSFMPKKQKPLQKKGFFLWRRERDSNPCYGSP